MAAPTSRPQLFRGGALTAAILVIVAGGTMIPGCTAQQRHEYLETQWDLLKREVDRIYREEILRCNGDTDCEYRALERRRVALEKLLEWYQGEVSKELQRSRDAEEDWREWIQSLPEEIRKLWEPVTETIDKLLPQSSITAEGFIETRQVIGGPVAISAPDGSHQDSGSVQEMLPAPDAVSMVIDSASAAGGFVPVDISRRLVTTGTFDFQDPDSGITVTFGLSTSIKLGAAEAHASGIVHRITGGSLQLERDGVTTDVRVRMGLEGEGLYLNDDGRGLLRFYAEPQFGSIDDDILLFGNKKRMKIPVEHFPGGLIRLTSGGEVPLGYLGAWTPDPISDANDDGIFDDADESAFLLRLATEETATDLNLDGVFDAADHVLFNQIHAEDRARSVFNASR